LLEGNHDVDGTRRAVWNGCQESDSRRGTVPLAQSELSDGMRLELVHARDFLKSN
jgi:hypothetical protein